MRNSFSKQKIAMLNQILTNHKQQIDKKNLFEVQQQEEVLQNHHIDKSESIKAIQPLGKAFSIEKQISGIQTSKSRILTKSDAKNKMDSIDEIMNIELKPESKILPKEKSSRFKQYEFKNKEIPSSQLKKSSQLTTSKIFNQTNQSTQISKRKGRKLIDINYDIVKKYFNSKMNKVSSSSKPSQIYQIVSPLYQLCGIQLEYPLVKLYKNCAYYGEHSNPKNQSYEGMIIFYQKKRLYYGEFVNQKKHGFGVEINFAEDAVYIGCCINGQKKDDFNVIKIHENYKGPLVNSLYEGFGQLKSKTSIYKGYFSKGERHGQGKQYFPETGLVLSGIFIHNQFSNDQQEIEQSHLKVIKNRPSKQLNPQSNDCFEFNYDFKDPHIQNNTSKNGSFRVKRKGGVIIKQQARIKTIEEQEPLINSIIKRR